MAGTLAVYEFFAVGYRRLWRASIFGQFISPLLFVVGIGMGVGTFVNRAGVLGVDYVSYLVPGMLVSVALQLAVGESTFPVFGHFHWNRYYYAMQATPVAERDMVAGQLAFLVTRVLLAGSVFLGVTAAFGKVHTWWVIGCLGVAVLIGLAGGSATMAYTAWITSESSFAVLFRFVLTPLTLFSGVFFPVAQLPVWLRPAAYVSPLWHAVELSRQFAFARFHLWPALGHTGYLLVWVAVGFALTRRAFARRLSS
ncbi:transport permease protein [Longispora fulva]|uniref:Transport permease protein n=1 Tax=Longispora fulva TaxID=619741 RepID=A0A8J7KM40_9ACTN|nr:ABC transporter permease [Longispora fulva]MBG6138726.1 lipooligosaccharide transport system permease protein [Longispora fulva]GIG58220.1 transport permease protein [Longispora fulva]